MQYKNRSGAIPRVVRNTSNLSRPLPRLSREVSRQIDPTPVLVEDTPKTPTPKRPVSATPLKDVLVAELVSGAAAQVSRQDPYDMLDKIVSEFAYRNEPVAKDAIENLPEFVETKPQTIEPKQVAADPVRNSSRIKKSGANSGLPKPVVSTSTEVDPVQDSMGDEPDELLVFDDVESESSGKSINKKKPKTKLSKRLKGKRQPELKTAYRKPDRRKKMPHKAKLVALTSVMGLMISGGLSVYQLSQQPDEYQQPAVLSATSISSTEEEKPSQAKPTSSDIYSHRVSSSLPKILRIPTAGIESRVVSVAQNDHGTLKVPSNIYDAGWYMDSSRVGAPGVVVINGVHSGDGVFSGLSQVKLGDTIELEKGDGNKVSYSIKRVEQDVVDFTAKSALTPPDGSVPWLTIVSCSDTGSMVCGSVGRTIVMARQM